MITRPRSPSGHRPAEVAAAARILDRVLARIPARHVAVVVAHPDDETIGCGARLARWDGATVVMMTDGAPRNLADARSHGYATAAEYAAARRSELHAALAIAGVGSSSLVTMDLPDQEVARNLTDAAHRMAEIFEALDTHVAVTHAYEGGHPDHDATAFVVHAARELVVRRGRSLTLLEMPYYRSDGPRTALQSFIPEPDSSVVVIPLTPPEQDLKQRMLAAHNSQAAIVSQFDTGRERFRLALPQDFCAPANGGELLYERHPWGLTGREWQMLAASATTSLGLTVPF